jgi:hypothetical protein
VIAITMPKRTTRRQHSIDYSGAALFAGGAGAFLLALAWGGAVYPWGSTEVLGALLVSATLLAAFVVVERRAPEPIIPFELLRQPVVASGAVSIFLGALCMFGVIAFVPLFVQGVIGTSATSSAYALTPFMLGIVVSAIASGQWVARTGRYRMNALLGPVVLGTGMFLLWRMDVGTSTGEVARNMAISGCGLGLMNQVFVVTSQNAVPMRMLGAVTALLQFCRAMGTTLGVTVFGTIINQSLPPGILAHGTLVHQLSADGRATLASAFHPAFLLALVACLGVFLVVFFGLKEQPLRGTVDDSAASDIGTATGTGVQAPQIGDVRSPG